LGTLLFRWNQKLKQQRKDTADNYINQVAYLMGFGSASQSLSSVDWVAEDIQKLETELKLQLKDYQQDLQNLKNYLQQSNSPVNLLIDELIDWVCKLDLLNTVFDRARTSLSQENISEESFRTFHEAYKTAREFIEDKIEDCQRAISSHYVQRMMHLLEDATADDLNQLRNEAASVLTQNKVFSRESFRTFVEAYGVVNQAQKG
jgi:chromosome segregation ATPase